MAGIINKIGDALHIGGNKDEDKNKKHETKYVADHKKHEDESLQLCLSSPSRVAIKYLLLGFSSATS
ncbi:hypothetical protein Tco_1300354 [Tanacetum coccineum]